MRQKTATQRKLKETVDVHLGAAGTRVGHLTFLRQGARELSQFNYEAAWLAFPEAFALSPDLPLAAGYSTRRAPGKADSVFHAGLADTAPDEWGLRVIERAHAKARKANPALPPLSALDHLSAVDDFSRIGALRLHRDGKYLQTAAAGRASTPPLIELEQMYLASRALEKNQETAADLAYLQGKGTSLGGMRPKCTVLDTNGALSLGKFPSVGDSINVTRGEVLALRLAARAGIHAATARAVAVSGTPVAVIARFDRTGGDARIPYLSAASMLQAKREETRSYAEIVDVIRRTSPRPDEDSQELWRRLVFNLLITNTDDHLHNHGFLYAGNRRWQLAPAFDLNPMPHKLCESTTWLTPNSGAITSLAMLMDDAAYFALTGAHALAIVAEVLDAVMDWREVAVSADVGLTAMKLDDFEDAFEHEITAEARALVASGCWSG